MCSTRRNRPECRPLYHKLHLLQSLPYQDSQLSPCVLINQHYRFQHHSTMRQSALFAALVALMSVEARDRTFTIINQCTQPIWTGIFNTDGHPPMVFADNAQKTTGFKLESNGGKKRLTAPDQWGGRIWPRTNCKQQGGQFVCQSGNCPGTDENCTQTGEVCTLAEFSLFPENGDWYNLSLVDGESHFNLVDSATRRQSRLFRYRRLQYPHANQT